MGRAMSIPNMTLQSEKKKPRVTVRRVRVGEENVAELDSRCAEDIRMQAVLLGEYKGDNALRQCRLPKERNALNKQGDGVGFGVSEAEAPVDGMGWDGKGRER